MYQCLNNGAIPSGKYSINAPAKSKTSSYVFTEICLQWWSKLLSPKSVKTKLTMRYVKREGDLPQNVTSFSFEVRKRQICFDGFYPLLYVDRATLQVYTDAVHKYYTQCIIEAARGQIVPGECMLFKKKKEEGGCSWLQIQWPQWPQIPANSLHIRFSLFLYLE